MHNMIIKNKNNARLEDYFDVITIPIRRDLSIDRYTHGSREIENENVHYRLHSDFIKHLWLWKTIVSCNEDINFVPTYFTCNQNCSILQHFHIPQLYNLYLLVES